jgi:hypothetical protein
MRAIPGAAINTGVRMRVSPQVLVLATGILALVPRLAESAAVLTSTTSATSCESVGVQNSECQLFTVDPYSGDPIVGTFEYTNDVALFFFTLTTETMLSAFTEGFELTGFDSYFGLFSADDGAIVQVPLADDPNASIALKSRDINPDPSAADYDDVLPDPDLFSVVTLEAGNYILALLQFGNDFVLDPTLGVDSLAAGFALDDPFFQTLCADTTSCTFSLNLIATPVDTQPVPEPGTLSLIGLGISALVLGRRRRVGTRSIPR